MHLWVKSAKKIQQKILGSGPLLKGRYAVGKQETQNLFHLALLDKALCSILSLLQKDEGAGGGAEKIPFYDKHARTLGLATSRSREPATNGY